MRVHEAAKQCGLFHLLYRPTHALSGGEKARCALAGVLAMRPGLLLIDEPTASLDPPARQQVFRILESLTTKGKTIVLATHEIEIAHNWADYVLILQEGSLLASGPATSIMNDQALLVHIGLDKPWYSELTKR